MANTKQATKRAKQAEAHRQHNMSQRSAARTAMKKVITALKAGDHQQANELFRGAVSLLDRYARLGVMHANKAARLKSRLNHRIKSAAKA